MFEQVFEAVCKNTEATLQMQQEWFRRSCVCLPGMPTASSAWVEQVQTVQKKWAKVCEDLVKKQQGSLIAQCGAGRKLIEEALGVTAAKDPEEFRAKAIECWQKGFDCLRQLSEAHLQDFRETVLKWADLVGKPGLAAAPLN